MARTPATPPTRRQRGFEPTGGLVKHQIRSVGESRGFAVARLLTHWAEIAGEDMARITRPVKVGYGREGFGATLTLLTTGAMVALMLAIAWKRCDDTAFVVTIIGLNLALFSLPIVMAQGDQGVTPLLQVDAYAVFYMGLVLIGALATCTFGRSWLKGYPDNREEFYLLLLIATAGGLVLVAITLLSAYSITMRSLFDAPLLGDVELVQMGCGIAVVSFLPLCQLRRNNVIVDAFTLRASASTRRLNASQLSSRLKNRDSGALAGSPPCACSLSPRS